MILLASGAYHSARLTRARRPPEKLKDDAVAALVATDDVQRRFLIHAAHVRGLFKSLLPDERSQEFVEQVHVLKILAEKIRADLPEVNIAAVMAEVEALLNRSIASDGPLF